MAWISRFILLALLSTAAATGEEKLSVSFLSPSQGAMVREYVSVSYEIRGEMPAGYHAVLFVKHPSGEYVSWGSSVSKSHSRVQLGGLRELGGADVPGRLFELVVVITQEAPRMHERTRKLPPNIASETIRVQVN